MKHLSERHVVVFVDDEPEVLSAIRRTLRGEPYQILTTSRPEEALAWVRSIDVSAVVSDEQMPGMCGTELLARVWSKSPATARVILTAHGEPAEPSSAEWLIAKPWDDTRLRSALRDFLFQREMEDPRRRRSFERKGAKQLARPGGEA